MRSIFGLITAAALFGHACAAAVPAFELRYTLYNNHHSVIGHIERQLRYNAAHQFTLSDTTQLQSAKINNELQLNINGIIQAKGYRPKHYTLILANPAQIQHKSIPQNSYDNASYLLQLQYDLLHHRKALHYTIWHGDTLVPTRFHQMAQKVIETPMGNINAIVIQSHPTHDSITRLYFAPQMHDNLVAFQQFENGHLSLESLISS